MIKETFKNLKIFSEFYRFKNDLSAILKICDSQFPYLVKINLRDKVDFSLDAAKMYD